MGTNLPSGTTPVMGLFGGQSFRSARMKGRRRNADGEIDLLSDSVAGQGNDQAAEHEKCVGVR